MNDIRIIINYILSPGGEQHLEVIPNDQSYRYRAIMGENNVYLHFTLDRYVDIPVGAWIEFQGSRYELNTPSQFTKNNRENFDYTLLFQGEQERLKRYRFRETFINSNGEVIKDERRLKFSYTAKPIDHLTMLVNNLNSRLTESGWTVDICIDAVEKTITYDNNNCFEALAHIAEEFQSEWEITGKAISLRKVEYFKNVPLPLSYGKGKGFKPGVGRVNYTESNPIEILLVQGGSRNLNIATYGHETLKLPYYYQRLSFDGEHFSDEEGFNSSTARTYRVEDGQTITKLPHVIKTGVEGSIDCSNIYPQRVGTVTAVEEFPEGWDFWDSTIPDALDYSQKGIIIKGEAATVIFQSGRLAGKEFQIVSSENKTTGDAVLTGYIHNDADYPNNPNKKRGRFKLLSQTIDGLEMPNEQFRPTAGDKYVVFNISMPQAYIRDDATKSGASWDMFREAVRYFYNNDQPKFTFKGELNGNWAKDDWINIGGKIIPGGYVLFKDDQFLSEGVSVRIIGVKDYLYDPHSPIIELSNAPTPTNLSSTINKIDQNEVKVEEINRNTIQFAKRGFTQVEETARALENETIRNALGFSESVNPITVHSMISYQGNTTLQYRFINNTTDREEVPLSVSFDNNTKKLQVGGGIIQHMTLPSTSEVRPRGKDDYWFWRMLPFTSGDLDDNKEYYLFAKVPIPPPSSTSTGFGYVISEDYIEPFAESGFVFLWIGILNKPFYGERSFAFMYGFSELSPYQLTINRVASADGKSFFDLAGQSFKLSDANYTRGMDWNITASNQLTIKGSVNALGAVLGGFTIDNTKIRSKKTINGVSNILLNGADGSGHLAGGNLSWDGTGLLTLKKGQANLKVPFTDLGFISSNYNINPDVAPNIRASAGVCGAGSEPRLILPVSNSYIGSQCIIVNPEGTRQCGAIKVRQSNGSNFYNMGTNELYLWPNTVARFTNVGTNSEKAQWLCEYLVSDSVMNYYTT